MSNFKFDKYRAEVNDRILERLREPELSQYIRDFIIFFERGDLGEARTFSEYCNWILQVQALFDDLMSPNQRVRFRELVKGFLLATAEDSAALNLEVRAGRVERFLGVRYRTSFFEFYQFLAELFSGIDLTDGAYGRDPLFR